MEFSLNVKEIQWISWIQRIWQILNCGQFNDPCWSIGKMLVTQWNHFWLMLSCHWINWNQLKLFRRNSKVAIYLWTIENITLNTRFDQCVGTDILEMNSHSVKRGEVWISSSTADVTIWFCNIFQVWSLPPRNKLSFFHV